MRREPWIRVERFEALQAELERARAMLLEAGETMIEQERIIAELRAERPAWYTPAVEA